MDAVSLLKEAASFLQHPANGQSHAHEEAAGELKQRIETFFAPRTELTFGEKAVGLTFNPGGMSEVNEIKTASANLIDVLDGQRLKAKVDNNGEKIAQFTLAIRAVQDGQMWGVKATTWQY